MNLDWVCRNVFHVAEYLFTLILVIKSIVLLKNNELGFFLCSIEEISPKDVKSGKKLNLIHLNYVFKTDTDSDISVLLSKMLYSIFFISCVRQSFEVSTVWKTSSSTIV